MNQQITLSDILSSVINNRSRVLMTFLTVMVLVTMAYLMWPRKYGSEGRLFVQLGKTGTGMDPTPGGQSISIQDSRETEVLSVGELVKSRAIVSKVVEAIGPDEILKSKFDFLPSIPMPNLSFGSNKGGMSKEEYEKLKRFELACKKIEEELAVSTEKKTCVISVYCTANSPLLAQKIVSRILAETQAKHLEVNSVSPSKAFFDNNFAGKQSSLIAAQKELGDFRNEHSFLSISGAVNTQQSIINKLKLELIDADVQLKQAESRLKNIRKQMTGIDQTVSIPKSGVEKLSTEESRTELFKLESELNRQEQLLSQNHPRLTLLKESVASLRDQFDVLPSDRTESVEQFNPVFEKVKVSLVHAIADEKSARSRLEHLRSKNELAANQLEKLNGLAVEAGQRNRDVDIAQRELEVFIQKRAEATIIAELDDTNVSDVVVAQAATLPIKHHSPRGSLMLGGGMILALLSSLAMALFLDRNRFGDSLRAEDLESVLDIPVLVTLPRVQSVRSMVS